MPLPDYQRRAIENPARFCWRNWARQTGKSHVSSLRRLIRGIARKRRQIFMSAGERQSVELMDKVRQHLQVLKLAAKQDSVLQASGIKTLEITIPGVTRITAIPANPETARGFTGDVLLDEFAVHGHDREIWAAMLPTIIRQNGELDIASTPKGRTNTFAEMRNNPMFDLSTITIHDAIADSLDIPAAPLHGVDAAALCRLCGDDEIWRQEFLCEFIDDASVCLKLDDIMGCVDPDLPMRTVEELQRSEHDLYVGVDVGRRNDRTVVWVLSAIEASFRTEAVFVLEGASFSDQRFVLAGLLENRHVRRCCIDETGIGMQLAEELNEKFGRYRVDPVYFTSAVKSQLASALRILVQAREIVLPDDEKMIEDFHSVEKSVTAAGNVVIGSPRTKEGHADRFWAAALAVRAVRTSRPAKINVGVSQMAAVRFPRLATRLAR